jgi:hypothetical protein
VSGSGSRRHPGRIRSPASRDFPRPPSARLPPPLTFPSLARLRPYSGAAGSLVPVALPKCPVCLLAYAGSAGFAWAKSRARARLRRRLRGTMKRRKDRPAGAHGPGAH